MSHSIFAGLSINQVVTLLNRDVVGQPEAKRALATALRQRARRSVLPESSRGRIGHLLMIGPAGVGRTEMTRRAAAFANAPFLKIDASLLLAGVDGEKLVRDLVEVSAKLHGDQARDTAQLEAVRLAEERLLDALMPKRRGPGFAIDISADSEEARQRMRAQLHGGELEQREIEVDLPQRSHSEHVVGESNNHQGKLQRRSVTIAEIRPLLVEEQLNSLINEEQTLRHALESCQRDGIVFIADIDRLIARGDGDDARREAVQRDLLSLIEGRTIHTRVGALRTDQLLFVGAGVFHTVRPSELIPELQGRFSLRVEVPGLGHDDIRAILAEPERGLAAQYSALFAADGGRLEFAEDALERLAEIAVAMNAQSGDIGAHRLPVLMAKLLEHCDSDAVLRINAEAVDAVLGDILDSPEISQRLL